MLSRTLMHEMSRNGLHSSVSVSVLLGLIVGEEIGI